MKKILVLFAILAFGLALSAQTTVKEDEALTYTYSDTLNLTGDSVFSVTYYAKDYFENMHLQVNADTAADGYTKVEISVEGSLDYSNWTAFTDTITLSATDADSDHKLYQTLYWNYLKVKVRAIDSTQYTLLNYNILFDINE